MKVTGSTLKKLLSISLAAVTLTAAAELPALSAAAYAENTDDSVSASGTVSECGIAVVYNSDFLGRVYADCEKDVKFYDTLDVVLHCFGTKSATYTLQKNLY